MCMYVHMHSLSGQVGGWEGREGKGGESAEEHSTRHHPLLRIGAEVALLKGAIVLRSRRSGPRVGVFLPRRGAIWGIFTFPLLV